MRHTNNKILPFVLASGLFTGSLAQAAQLGKLEVLSGAGEPFLAEIRIDQIQPEERASLQARLASSDAFKAARLTLDPNLKSLQFAVQNGTQPGTAVVKVTSAKALPAGFIDALVELTWAGGRVAREYTLAVPVGAAKAAEPATRLPEIKPPVTPPVAPAAPPAAVASPAQPAVPAPAAESTEKPVAQKSADQPPLAEPPLNVKRGDTLSELAMRLTGDGVSLNQAMAAIYEANRGAFINNSVHLLREGVQLQVPYRTAIRSKNAREALVILAQNDDRNVYSAYARQLGILTVEKQAASTASTSTQGSIAPKEKTAATPPATPTDKLQIAPGSVQGRSNADASAEELLAKNKALAEANERIALLEKNVTDLQRLLDMQKDLAEQAPATAPTAENQAPAEPVASESEDLAPVVDVPSETLTDPELAAVPTEPAPPAVAAQPAVEVPAEVGFDWLPWALAGGAGLVLIASLLVVVRSRRKKSEQSEEDFQADDVSFSQVTEYDVAPAAAPVDPAPAPESTPGLDRAENSDFDLDEVLKDAQQAPEPVQEPEPLREVRIEPTFATSPTQDIPELNEPSEEARQQPDSLESEVRLEFPDEETVAPASNSILDDLDQIEKGSLAAREELSELRSQPMQDEATESFDASAAFDDLLDAGKSDQAEPAAELPAELVELDLDVPNPETDDATWQEVATKLDLAGAYVEIGDADGAKELLNEILKKGDPDQVRKAKALLATLS